MDKVEKNYKQRNLDLEIATNIFDIKKVYYYKYEDGLILYHYIPSGKSWRTHSIDARPIPKFSTNATAAYSIIEHTRKQYHWVLKSPFHVNGHWHVSIAPIKRNGGGPIDTNIIFTGTGDTMMDTVCLTILSTIKQPRATILEEIKL